MKNLILGLALAATGTFTYAQQVQKRTPLDPAKMEERRVEHLKQMQIDLNLTDAQLEKISELQERRMVERKANLETKRAKMQARAELIKAKKAQHEEEMRQILTSEQYQKWQAQNQQKMDRRQEMMKSKHKKRMHPMK